MPSPGPVRGACPGFGAVGASGMWLQAASGRLGREGLMNPVSAARHDGWIVEAVVHTPSNLAVW